MNKLTNILYTNLNARWKLVLLTFLAGFLMVAWPHLGLKTPDLSSNNLLNPQPAMVKDPMKEIIPKLELIRNTFSLKKDTSLIPQAGASEEFAQASSYAVVDMDSGKVILEKNLNTPLPMASLTKVMSSIVALDLVRGDKQFIVSEEASKVEPTNMGLIPGQSWSLEELLHAVLLTSSNDAVEVIKEGIDSQYGPGAFIKAMNAKAKILGLKNTSFDNPQGYDGNSHYSSAADLAVLSQYAILNYPQIGEISKKDYQFFPETQTHKQADLYNWNGLLGVYPGVFGLKIGNTERAQKTTIVASERDGKKLIVVLLGAPGVLERDLWASKLLDLAFSREAGFTPVNLSEETLREKYQSWEYF